MTRYKNLTNYQATNIQNIGLLVEVLKVTDSKWKFDSLEHDPEYVVSDGRNDKHINKKGLYAWFKHDDFDLYMDLVKLPYQPGDVLLCRESWTEVETCNGNLYIIYKSDGNRDADDNHKFKGWHSPVTIPTEAIRHKLTIKGVSVKHIYDLTNEEVRKAGFVSDGYTMRGIFGMQWNVDHKKQEEKYESNPWVVCVEI